MHDMGLEMQVKMDRIVYRTKSRRKNRDIWSSKIILLHAHFPGLYLIVTWLYCIRKEFYCRYQKELAVVQSNRSLAISLR